MSWPPAILVNPPESLLAGVVLWKRRGAALVTVVVKQLFGVGAGGVARAVAPHPSDALTGDDRVPFKPRADVIVALPEVPQATLDIWRGSTSILQKKLAAGECTRRSLPPSGRGPAATMIELPADLDPRIYQIAPEDQQLDSLMPGDCLIIHGGTKARLLCPKLEVTIHLRSPRGGSTPIALNIDAIEWDIPNARCAVIARGQTSWSDAVDAVVVSSPAVDTLTLDPAAAEKARAPFVSPFRRQGSNPVPPPGLPVRSPGERGNTSPLDEFAAARARAAALMPFNAPSPAARGPMPPASLDRTSFDEDLGAAIRTPATPFVSPSQPTSRAVLAATPTTPRIDSGTIAAEASEIQRIARSLTLGQPQAPPSRDAPTAHLQSPFETTAFSDELIEYARAQATPPVPFASKQPTASASRVVIPPTPIGPRLDTGTMVAEGSEIQRLARALKGV